MSQSTSERYKIEEQIGSGGMATVYKAQDTVLQRPVALKLLNDQVDPALKSRFQAEAQAVAQLNHPNVVNVYDVGELDGAPYIVMEYVHGTNLKRLIQENGPLSIEDAENVVRQVGAALSYAHRNGLVHCDVKPHNILLAPDGRAKLVDFGIAQAQVDRRHRKNEQVYGTPLYIAPEQAAGKAVSARTDVYGLGLVLWEAVTGLPPERPEPGRPVSLPFDRAHLPSALEALIATATATNPAARYGSVEDVVRALQATHTAQRTPADRTVAYRPVTAAMPNGQSSATPAGATRAMPGSAPRGRRRLPLLPLAALALLLLGLGGAALANALGVGDNGNGTNAFPPGPVSEINNTAEADMVQVPVFEGRTLAKARDIARESGLAPDVVFVQGDAPDGVVLTQDPGVGDSVRRGDTVRLEVSRAEAGVEAPTERPADPDPTATDPPRDGEPTQALERSVDPTAPAAKSPTPTNEPEVTPVADLVSGEYVIQLSALDQPVYLVAKENGLETRRTLGPGRYIEFQGAYVRVYAQPASAVAVTVNGRQRGTLLELAQRNSRETITTPDAFIEYPTGGASDAAQPGDDKDKDQSGQNKGRGNNDDDKEKAD
ncbi:MAG: protein kinase [Chloroflexota bacterium]|nr:protein kinase [Chloroflexota bacterium]